MASRPPPRDSKSLHLKIKESLRSGTRRLKQHISNSSSSLRLSPQHSGSSAAVSQDSQSTSPAAPRTSNQPDLPDAAQQAASPLTEVSNLATTATTVDSGSSLSLQSGGQLPDTSTLGAAHRIAISQPILHQGSAATDHLAEPTTVASSVPPTVETHTLGSFSPPLNVVPASPVRSGTPSQINHVQSTSHSALDAPATPSTGSTAGAPTSVGTADSATIASTDLDKFKVTGKTAWIGLKAALRVLEKSADVFPPLRSAVSGFIHCLDIVESAAINRQDYEKLATELKMVTDTLSQYVHELGSEGRSGSIAYIASSIEALVEHINKQRGRGRTERILESSEDKDDIMECYREIEVLFRQIQSDVTLRTWRNTNKQLVSTLLQRLSPADDARYDSSYSTTIKRRECTPETREKVQADLHDWVRDPNAAKVYWMNGMAGTGKTTIAYSLCKWLEVKKLLGADFFCSRISASCRNVNHIVPTIAYQLALYSPAFRSSLCRILEEDPDASKRDVVRQFEKLVREPMAEMRVAVPEGVVVVIDALDECEDNYGVRLILQVLLRFAGDLPLKFFVTSRPEPGISDRMLSPSKHSPSVLHLHDIEQSIVEGDIKKYLTEALGVMSPPPSDHQIEQLTKRAGKLFIFAATAARYICPDDMYVDSSACLQTMLAIDSKPSIKGQPSRKYDDLNRLYTAILTMAFDKRLECEEIEARRLVLWTVICAREPMTSKALTSVLGLNENQVVFALRSMGSVLHVSENGLISTLHASFSDYLIDPLRSGEFHCDEAQHNQLLAERCFEVMEVELRFNICRLDSSFVFDNDVLDLAKRAETFISPCLFYACRYWGEHLGLANFGDELHGPLIDFLSHRLLFWMEVLSLSQCIGIGAQILLQAQNWLSANCSEAKWLKQLSEARNFVTRHAANPCSLSTPHIYISSLLLLPKGNSVYENYQRLTRRPIGMRRASVKEMEQALLATWMSPSEVNVVTFSFNGALVAVGSADGTVCTRNAYTGALISGPFQGHMRSIYSIAFSPDGTRIASGCEDGIIRVWDAHNGMAVFEPLEGHTHSVNSVVFSHDGTLIASGSNDCTIRVWDAYSGGVASGPFKGHTGSVNSVVFSDDDTRLASGSYDRTIRVWNIQTGATVSDPFQGHTGSVHSVVFSPDGTRIVSGSHDRTIRVWDARTGAAVLDPLKGHKGSIYTVAFSPDGTRIVSGSYDCTIRTWDAHTGVAGFHPFEGHTGSVFSVAFSPDGTRIVSGSNDRTIRVWDAHTDPTKPDPLEGHTGSVHSVAFSPDGTRIVSGSNDCTVRVWDVLTDAAVSDPFQGHKGSVYSVSFSPDGTRIVSGSEDRTIRVWDTRTGTAVLDPLEGHKDSVNSVAFSPDGTRIVSGSNDRTVRIWDARTGTDMFSPFKGHMGSVFSVAFSPDGSRIVSGSYDCNIYVLDVHIGTALFDSLKGHTDSVNSVAFSPDSTRIVSGSNDHTVRVWDARTGTTVSELFNGHAGPVYSVAFSPDGRHIVSGSDHCSILVQDTYTGATVSGPFEGHTNSVYSVEFSSDGTKIVSGSNDFTIRLWNAHTAAPGVSRGHPGSVNSPQFPPDATRIGPNSTLMNSYPPEIRELCVDLQNDPHELLTGSWTFSSNGWISVGCTRICWVSPDLHKFLPSPPAMMVIGPSCLSYIDYRNPAWGERWSECYASE